MNINEKCIPHGFEDCCNVEVPVLSAHECIEFSSECSGAVEYRMPMSGTGRSFARCDGHMRRRWATQERLSRDYGVPLVYSGE